jgi:hypothetical protein
MAVSCPKCESNELDGLEVLKEGRRRVKCET